MRIKMQHQYVMASEFLAQQRKQVNGAYEVVGYDPVAKTLKDAKESGFVGIELAPFTLGKPVDHVNTNEIADVIGAMRETGAEITGLHWILSNLDKVGLNPNMSIFSDGNLKDDTLKY